MGAQFGAVASGREEQKTVSLKTSAQRYDNIHPQAAALGLATTCLIGLGVAWRWALIQLTQIFVRPELDTLRQQVASISFS